MTKRNEKKHNSYDRLVLLEQPIHGSGSQMKEWMKVCSEWKVASQRMPVVCKSSGSSMTGAHVILASSPDTNSSNNSDDAPLISSEQLQHVGSSLLAGVGSGTLSSIVCAPLDLIRTRMQVMGDLKPSSSTTAVTNHHQGIVSNLRGIVQVDGIRGCFRGLSATLMTVPFFWGLYFPLYEHLKHRYHHFFLNGNNEDTTSKDEDGSFRILQFEEPSEGILLQRRPTQLPHHHLTSTTAKQQEQSPEVPSLVHLCSAITAGAVADCICNPLFVVRTRMQTEALHYMEMPIQERKPHSIGRTILKLYQEGGIPVFWRGLTASLLGLIHVGIQFPVYEKIKAEARNRSPTNEESPLDLLLASGLSKMIACSISYPHEVLRSRMMDYRGTDSNKKGLIGTYRRIVAKEGFAALYTGLSVTLVRVIPNCCITFMSYEILLRYVKQNLTI